MPHVTHLSSIEIINGCIYYRHVKYGSYLKSSRCDEKLCGNKVSRWFDIQKTKKNIMLITASKQDCLRIMPNTNIFKSGSYDDCHFSGIVILMMAVLRNNKSEYLWTNEIHQLSSSCKTNSLTTYSHHGTKGYVYSFGNKPNYGNTNGSTVSTYSNKFSKNKILQTMKNEDAKFIEDKCKDCLQHGIDKLSTYI